jgi:hypothetical protein
MRFREAVRLAGILCLVNGYPLARRLPAVL